MSSPKSQGLLILLSAPSGAGKTTLCQQLLAKYPQMTRAITCTSRAPREGERDGVDYYFLDEAAFAKKVEAGEFLEHANVYGHRYGTLKSEISAKLQAGKDVLLNVDVQGACSIRAQAETNPRLNRALVSVFLTPASLSVLEERLKKRGLDSPPAIKKRLSVAAQEIAQWKEFDYLLISTTIAEDVRRMELVLEAERMRTNRAKPPQF